MTISVSSHAFMEGDVQIDEVKLPFTDGLSESIQFPACTIDDSCKYTTQMLSFLSRSTRLGVNVKIFMR